MARTDIAGLLTGIGQAPIDPMAGGSIRDREIALQQQALQGFRRGVGALTGGAVDARSTAEKAQDALQKLDPNKREDREKILQIISRVNPERVSALKQAFAERDRQEQEAKRERELEDAREARAVAGEKRAVAGEKRAVEAGERAVRTENRAIDKLLFDRERALSEDERSARRLEISEERLAMDKASKNKDLTEAEEQKVRDGTLRGLYIDQAKSQDRQQLATAIEKGMDLSTAEKALYGSSNAMASAPSDDEAAAMEAIVNSEGFKASVKGLPRKTNIIGQDRGLHADVKRALFFKAKELQRMNTKLTVEQALREALEVVKNLYDIDDDDPNADVL